jgi:nicotinate dehydrogenase subunit A
MKSTINGVERTLEVDPDMPLLWALRDVLGLTGTKYGCGEGRCGSCTVLADGKAVRACLTRAVVPRTVTTIEGLAAGNRLHPVQQAFVDAQAFQCGFCTPGMVMGAVALLARTVRPTDDEIRHALDGHLCRCGTYPRIVRAVRAASDVLAREGRHG